MWRGIPRHQHDIGISCRRSWRWRGHFDSHPDGRLMIPVRHPQSAENGRLCDRSAKCRSLPQHDLRTAGRIGPIPTRRNSVAIVFFSFSCMGGLGVCHAGVGLCGRIRALARNLQARGMLHTMRRSYGAMAFVCVLAGRDHKRSCRQPLPSMSAAHQRQPRQSGTAVGRVVESLSIVVLISSFRAGVF